MTNYPVRAALWWYSYPRTDEKASAYRPIVSQANLAVSV